MSVFALPDRPCPGWLAPVLVGVVAFAVFAGSLGYGFVYDDENQVLDNPWIWQPRFLPDLLTKGVWSFERGQPSNYYRPIQTFLYFLDAQVFGRHPFGFHLTTVLAHALVAVVALLLLRRVTGAGPAAFAALLFAVHPAHVESVAWIAGSTDVDCALFLFLCLLVWSHAFGADGRRRFALAALAGLLSGLALLAKETAAVTPLLALVLPPFRIDPARSAEPCRPPTAWSRPRDAALVLATTALVGVLYLPLRFHALGGLGPLVAHPGLSQGRAIASGLALVPRYLSVAFVPWRLVPDRVFRPAMGFLDPLALLGGLVLIGALAVVIALRRRAPAVAFGIALLLLPLLPVLRIQSLGFDPQADRYLYIPALGAGLLVAEGAGWAWRRATGPAGSPAARRLLVAGCALLVVLAGARAVTAAPIWRDDERLARAGIALEPRTVTMRLLLAHALDGTGRVDEAYRVAREAAALDPASRSAAAALEGIRVEVEGKNPEARIDMLRAALAVDPGQPHLWVDLSAACSEAHRYQEGITAALRALALDPYNVTALLDLGTARGRLGDHAGEEREALHLLDLRPDMASGWLNLGAARLGLHDPDRAEDALRRALSLDPNLARAHLYLAWIATHRRRTAEALSEAERAAALAPGDRDIWNQLGVARVETGDRDGARRAWQRALALEPGDETATKNLRRLDQPDSAPPP